MRILFCSTGGAGHFTPLVPFIEAARGRGDEVVVVAPQSPHITVTDTDVTFHTSSPADPEASRALWERAARVPHDEATRLIDGEYFGRLTTLAMLPTVQALADELGPDLIIREPCAYAGAVVATRRGIAHAQVAISTAKAEWGCASMVASILEELEPRMEDVLHEAPYMSSLPASLDPSPFPTTLRYRLEQVREDTVEDQWAAGDAPLVYVTLGTVASTLPDAPSSFRALIDAVAGLGARVLVTTGPGVDARALGPLPADVYVRSWVPQAAVFIRASVVLCHGGSGTSYGALAAGLPIVFTPMLADQHTNARLICAAGAGIEVDVGRERSPGFRAIDVDEVARIREAVVGVLREETYRDSAQRISLEIAASSTARECLDRILASR